MGGCEFDKSPTTRATKRSTGVARGRAGDDAQPRGSQVKNIETESQIASSRLCGKICE